MSADKGEYKKAHRQVADHNGLRRDVIRPRRVAETHSPPSAVESDPQKCDAAPDGCCRSLATARRSGEERGTR